MPAIIQQLEGVVVSRQAAREKVVPLSVFSAEQGLVLAYLRTHSASKNPLPPIDLFDEVELVLNSSNQGRTWFVKEAVILRRRAEIGHSYPSLKWASRFTGMIARNSVPEEGRAQVRRLLSQALGSFAVSTNNPEIVYLKSLYSFARDEGYPVRQHWLETLSGVHKEEAERLLRTPLAELTPEENASRLIPRLENFLRDQTEILLE